MIDSQMEKVKLGQRLTSKCWCSISNNIPNLKKLEHLLYQDESVKRVFTPTPMVSYHSARKLSSYLVSAKLYPLERKRGSYKCDNSRCQVFNNIEEIDNS